MVRLGHECETLDLVDNRVAELPLLRCHQTLFFGWPAPYYLYLSIIEITCTVLIVGYAWKWREPAVQPSAEAPAAPAVSPTV